MELRPYQLRDYKNIVKSFETNTKVLYQCPTGGGKSVVIAQFVEDNKNKNILFLAHKREIITQMYDRLESLNIGCGFIMGQDERNMDSNILIGSISTLTRDKRIESVLQTKYDIIIIDEAHRTPTNSYSKVLEHLFLLNPNAILFGVTATPHRTDKKSLSDFYQDLILSDDIQTLIKDGYLSDYKTFTTKLEDITSEVVVNSDDYQITSLSKFMRKPEYIKYLVESYKKLGNNKQMIVFCVDKAHAKDVTQAYKDAGYTKIAYLDSDTPVEKRNKIILDYSKGEIQIIICIETLTEGVDLPETGVIQLARPTKSIILYLQMLGRGLRLKQNGEPLIILDNSGNTQEHGVVSAEREWTLKIKNNPSHKRTKNKIVGKRADGSYTDDTDEMDFLEIEELTPEEYIEKMGMDDKKAEAFNDELVKKSLAVLEKLVKLIEKYKGVTKATIPSSYGTSISDNIRIKFGRFSFEFDYKSKKLKTENSNYYGMGLEEGILFGEMSIFLQKNIKFIDNINNEIKEILDSKINVNELRDKLKEINIEKTKHFLEKTINNGENITLTNERYTSLLNARDYRYNRFNKIEFENKKLNKTQNKIKIYNNDDYKGSYIVNLEKILDVVLNNIEF
jgi:superfamily II DNA or RNA helicase